MSEQSPLSRDERSVLLAIKAPTPTKTIEALAVKAHLEPGVVSTALRGLEQRDTPLIRTDVPHGLGWVATDAGCEVAPDPRFSLERALDTLQWWRHGRRELRQMKRRAEAFAATVENAGSRARRKKPHERIDDLEARISALESRTLAIEAMGEQSDHARTLG
jgi:hypothetical protein